MEIQHPHRPTHKKKWTEYLLEFLMLFLAVFLGFTAENIREHKIERHREHQFIQSMINDLKTDTSSLGTLIHMYKEQKKKQDTLMSLFDTLDSGYNIKFMELLDYVRGFPDFIYTDATIQQLKSAGGFRLIRNKNAVDSIISYTSAVSRTYINTDDLGVCIHEMQNWVHEYLNFYEINKAVKNGLSPADMQASKTDVLISHDKKDRIKFYNKVFKFQWLMDIILSYNFIPLKQRAERLITFLENEY
jgi:hypothetical protein